MNKWGVSKQCQRLVHEHIAERALYVGKGPGFKEPFDYPFTLNDTLVVFWRSSKVAITDGLLACINRILSPNVFPSGVKNSSPHDGENVRTPSKSMSIISPSFRPRNCGCKAANDSRPACREISVVPNFLSSMVMVLIGYHREASAQIIFTFSYGEILIFALHAQFRIATLKKQIDRILRNNFLYIF